MKGQLLKKIRGKLKKQLPSSPFPREHPSQNIEPNMHIRKTKEQKL